MTTVRIPQRSAAVVVLLLLLVAGAIAARGALYYQTADFFCLYHGARSLALGHDPYNSAWWQSVTGGLFPDPWRGVGTSSCVTSYAYPLWTAVAMLPLGVLPLELAASLWLALSIGAAVFGAWALWRSFGGTRENAALFATVVFTSQPFWVLLVGGQITGVMVGLTGALALALARSREVHAGIALAFLALKPQLVVLTIPAMLWHAFAQGRRRLVVSAVVTGAVLIALPLLFLSTWPLEWLGQEGPHRLQIAGLLPTAWGFSADVLGNVLWGAVLSVVLIAACVAIARRIDALALLALSIPLSLVVTLHAWSYDYLLLAGPWAFVLARADRTRASGTALLAAVLLVASPLPWLLYAVGFTRGVETISVLVPAATALLVATAARDAATRSRVARTMTSPEPVS
jgi:hypothetical protein